MWFTYLKVDAAGGDLTHDLAVAPSRDQAPAIRDTGVEHAGSLDVPRLDGASGFAPIGLAVVGGAVPAILGAAVSARRLRGRRRAAVDR
jgi:hypothetical protein